MHKLVQSLTAQDGEVPWAQIEQCQEQIEAVADDLLAAVERVADDVAPDDSSAQIALLAIHILAAARDQRLYPPLLRLLPQDFAFDVLGETATYTLQKVIIACFNGDAEPLFELVRVADLDPYIRWSAFSALAFLTWQGAVDAQAMRACLERFDDDPPVEADQDWIGWAEAIELLGWRDLAPRVERALAARPDMEAMLTRASFRTNLAEAEAAAPGDASRFDAQNIGYLGDLEAELSWLEEDEFDDTLDDADDDLPLLDPPETFTPQQRAAYLSGEPVRNPLRHVGRNDPCPCGSGKKYKRCCGAAA